MNPGAGTKDRITRAAEEHGFSGVVRIARPHELPVCMAFGWANRERREENTPDTRLAIASGTKLLTALAVGALIDDGRLSLDARLHDVASFDLPGVDERVTIGQLLTHKSGVFDYYDEELHTDPDSFQMAVPPHQLLRPRDYHPMVVGGEMKFPPGERFSYSNGGYVLLGMLVEEACGDYHRFVESRVMERAGMESSGFFRFDELPDHTATGYTEKDGEWCTNVDTLPIIGGPDGGAYVTVLDMERLWRAFLGEQILSPQLTRLFQQKSAHYKNAIHYGHGLWIRDDGREPPYIYVEGCDAGVSFRSSFHDGDLVVTVVSNTTDGAWPMVRAIDDHLRRS